MNDVRAGCAAGAGKRRTMKPTGRRRIARLSANGCTGLMDDDYVVVSRLALWRPRAVIATPILFFLAFVWFGEVLYDSWRVNSGPNAWFMVATPVTRNRPYAASEYAFGPLTPHRTNVTKI